MTATRQNQTSATMNALVSAFTIWAVPCPTTCTRTRGASALQANPAGIPQMAVAAAAARKTTTAVRTAGACAPRAAAGSAESAGAGAAAAPDSGDGSPGGTGRFVASVMFPSFMPNERGQDGPRPRRTTSPGQVRALDERRG